MKYFTRAGAAMVAALLLAACGGGGGGNDNDDSNGPRAVLPTLQEDTEAAGPTTDVRAANYYGIPDGRSIGFAADRWDYEVTVSGAVVATVVRRITMSSTPGFLDVSVEDSRTGAGRPLRYQRTQAGVVRTQLFENDPDLPPEIVAAVGAWLELPEQLPAAGSTRGLMRQGAMGDVDGDGHPDSFRLQLRQTVVGMETLTLRNAAQAEALHLRVALVMEVVPSDRKNSTYRLETTEDAWWVAGVGMVRASASASDSDGLVLQPYTEELTGGTLNGTVLLAPLPDGSLRTIELTHNALVYDPTRQVYYASVPGAVAGRGNTLARIDAATGEVVHSGHVGSEPTALALSADGSTLYVGLDGSGEVARVRLPDMVVETTARLPLPAFGLSVGKVRAMAVSPTDAGLVALLLSDDYSYNVPVRLWRGGALSTSTASTGWNSWQLSGLAFSADGGSLFQIGAMLTRSRVSGDELVEEASVSASQSTNARLLRMPGGLVADNQVFSTDLQRLGTVPTGNGCAPAAATGRLLCLGYRDNEAAVLVVDAGTLAVVEQPRYRRHGDGRPELANQLVPGPAGQVALRYVNYPGFVPTSFTLFTSEALR